MKAIFKDSSFTSRFFQLWLVFFFCFAGGAIIGTVLTGGISDEMLAHKIRMLILSSASFIVPSFVLAYLWSEKPLQFLSFPKKTSPKICVFLILLMLVAVPFVNLLADLNTRISFPESLSGIEMQLRAMEARTLTQMEQLLTVHTVGGLLFNIFLVAVIPALGEELFFRGALQRIIADTRGAVFAIWLVAFIFSAFHFRFFGFIPILLLGAFFGYLLVWSRDIRLPITAHFANNFIIVLYFYLYKNKLVSGSFRTLGTGETWWIGVICGVIFVSGIFILRALIKGRMQYASTKNNNKKH